MEADKQAVKALLESVNGFKKAFKGHAIRSHSNPTFLLVEIHRLSEQGAVTMRLLAEKMSVSKPAMTQMINAQVNNGLVRRYFDENDRRVVLVELTDQGRERLSENFKKMFGMLKRMTDFLGPDDTAQCIHLLNRITDFMKENDGSECEEEND